MSGKGLQIEIGELKAKNVKWVVNWKGQKGQKNGEVVTANCYLELTIHHERFQDL